MICKGFYTANLPSNYSGTIRIAQDYVATEVFVQSSIVHPPKIFNTARCKLAFLPEKSNAHFIGKTSVSESLYSLAMIAAVNTIDTGLI